MAGLLADLASMILLIASWLVVHQHAAAFALLLAALALTAFWAAVAAFGVAGLGRSALLPLTISFGQASSRAARRWSRAG